MKHFFENSELVNSYIVVVNGNEVVFSDPNYKPALRRFLKLSSRTDSLVEFWYVHPNRDVLIEYSN